MSTHPSSETPMTKYRSYPKPEAEYQQIIENSDIFLQKLRAFHVFYATNFRVPTIGGSSLDLHRLFIEVTSRGGIEKVIGDRRWKEITAAFKFPTSITSASFVLRKYYLSLLYHFEQVYYFRKEEPTIIAAGQNAIEDGTASDILSANSNLEDGGVISGVIDGKFDDGYIVTVKLGSEEMKGVLYHVGPDVSQSFSISDDPGHHHHTKRKHQTARDPTHPKRNRSGYTFFFAEQYQILRSSYHGHERGISKKIGQLWSNLTEAEKEVYQEKGLRDKERYKAEMLEYKSSQHMQG